MHWLTRIRRKPSITPDSSPTAWGSPQVRPDSTTEVGPGKQSLPRKRLSRIKLYEFAGAVYQWTTCLFIIVLACSQLLAAIWDSRTTTDHIIYGRSPLLGPSQIVGTNDVPYPDRVIACVHNGFNYESKLVSSLLAAPGVAAMLEDSTGSAIHGYRLRQRRVGSVTDTLDSGALDIYVSSCTLIAKTIANIFAGCSALSYNNLTRDNLRVVDDWDSKNLYRLPNTLPVLIMPYWDNAAYSRHAIPTWEGDACIFRLEDAYATSKSDFGRASFRGVNQSVRHERTMEWLKRPGGVWRNGWYEDPEGMRWYSDVKSSGKGAPYFMMHRLFDMWTGNKVDCFNPNDCGPNPFIEEWGDKFSSSSRSFNINSIYIANGTEYGFFIYETYQQLTVRSVFDWETLVTNLSVCMILARWIVALVSLHSGAYRGKTLWFSGGIGCVSGAGSFAVLPFASLPRLKTTLAAFWTIGCRFEGQQSGLTEAWFAIYPAIAHLVLMYFSLLNLVAKALRRRMSDVLFAPTVIALCLLHYFRLELATSGWLRGVDGRVATVVFSDEVKKLQLSDYLTTDIAWRMNGRIALVFRLKLAILGVNLVPLALSRSFPVGPRCADLGLHGVEKALALRARYMGGLGCSLTYMIAVVDTSMRRLSSTTFTAKVVITDSDRSSNEDYERVKFRRDERSAEVTPVTPLLDHITRGPSMKAVLSNNTLPEELKVTTVSHEIALVNSYELIRLGYLIFGDKYLITFDEWDLLSSMAPFRSYCHF